MIGLWIQRLRTHKWITIAGLFGLICLYALIQEIIPRTVEIIHMRRSIQENRARVAQVEEWEWTVQRMEKKKRKLNSQIENLIYSQQQKNQFSNIYAFLSENAQKYNIALQSVRLGDSETGNRYTRLPITLKINARYHALGRYLNALETSEPIIQIETFFLEAKDMTSEDLTADVVIWVYFLT